MAWADTETASSALMMYLFPSMDMENLHWELISKEKAQALLDSTHYVKPSVREIPK